MSRLKIGIVEAERTVADGLCAMLRKIGYSCTAPSATYQQAMQMIRDENPDLLLLDPSLPGSKDGVEVAFKVRETFPVPIIFVTLDKDAEISARPSAAKPNAWLHKPFTRNSLFSAIETAINHFNAPGSPELLSPQHILVKDGYRIVKLFHHEILYLENEGNYIIFHTTDHRKIMVRGTMPAVLSTLNSDSFVRHHRSFSANLIHLKMVEPEELVLNGEVRLPLSSLYRSDLLKKWK